MTKSLRLGIAGLGTVGAGVIKIVQQNAALLSARSGVSVEVTAVCAQSRTKNRGVDLSNYAWEDDPVTLAKRDDVDVYVELMGGEDGPAKASVEAALGAGKHVVTANKALLAHHGHALASAAETAKVSLRFEAAVAGGIPVIKALTEGLAGNKITRIMGVMNGTCNYILTRMEHSGLPYDQIFEEANKSNPVVTREINILKQAYNSDVIWDEIVEIVNIDDPKEYVYDFTVPGNQTFLTLGGILVHNTLNTFHATGSGSTQMQGVPRVEELTRTTKNIKTPVMNIYLEKKFQKDDDKANLIASSIQHTKIKDLITSFEMIYDLDTNNTGYTKKDNVSNPFFVNLKSTKKNYEDMAWLLRIKLDRDKIIEKNVTTLDIKSSYLKFYKNYIGDLKGIKKSEKQIINSIVGTCVLSNFDNNDEPVIHIRFDIIDFDYDLLLNINNWIIDNFKLKGIDDIIGTNIDNNSRLISFDNKNKEFEETHEVVIYTEGINMTDIRHLDGIDFNRTYCNEINTINKYFGIEAARNALLKEFYQVFNEYNLNFHHLSILVDTITNLGILSSIDRHGINKLDTDPLSRASFEMPIEQLTKAALFGEVDQMRSVSSRIMAGRVISGGTGLCSLLLDTEYVMNSEYIEDEEAAERSNFNKVEENVIIRDIIKRKISDIFKPCF